VMEAMVTVVEEVLSCQGLEDVERHEHEHEPASLPFRFSRPVQCMHLSIDSVISTTCAGNSSSVEVSSFLLSTFQLFSLAFVFNARLCFGMCATCCHTRAATEARLCIQPFRTPRGPGARASATCTLCCGSLIIPTTGPSLLMKHCCSEPRRSNNKHTLMDGLLVASICRMRSPPSPSPPSRSPPALAIASLAVASRPRHQLPASMQQVLVLPAVRARGFGA
jgi:hypothetical protein